MLVLPVGLEADEFAGFGADQSFVTSSDFDSGESVTGVALGGSVTTMLCSSDDRLSAKSANVRFESLCRSSVPAIGAVGVGGDAGAGMVGATAGSGGELGDAGSAAAEGAFSRVTLGIEGNEAGEGSFTSPGTRAMAVCASLVALTEALRCSS